MRKELSKLNNLRKTFTGTFKRYGTKTNFKGFPEDTILLINIKDSNGKVVSDHCWFNLTKQFSELGELKEGGLIQFDARVKNYIKGYKGYKEEVQYERPLEEDYKLSFPTKIKRIK